MTPMPTCSLCRKTLGFRESVIVGPTEHAHRQCADAYTAAQLESHQPTHSRERGDLPEVILRELLTGDREEDYPE